MALQVVTKDDAGNILGAAVNLPATSTIGGSAVTALGTITSTSATALAVGRQGATNPVLNVNAATSSVVTGLNLTGAAAAAGMAVAVTSSGTDEALTIDAKGAGTITINGTATGKVVINKAQVKNQRQTISSDGAITIQSGNVVLTKGSAAAITLAAPSSQDDTEITVMSNSDFAHVITAPSAIILDGTTGANTTATFAAFKGASITFVATGVTWLTKSINAVTCAP